MSEYYGVSAPSSDFIAHYGVKGMKWGVRKAIEKGNVKALDKHYKKAAKKLEKLSKRADIEVQNQQAQKYNKVSKIARRVGHVGAAVTGLAVPTGIIQNNLVKSGKEGKEYWRSYYDKRIGEETKKVNALKAQDWADWRNGTYKDYGITKDEAAKRISNFHNEIMDKHGKHILLKEEKKGQMDAFDSQINTASNRRKGATIASLAGGGLAALGYGTAIGSKIKAHAAKKRTTAEGHAKAVAERDAWQNEMAKVFAGTKYGKKRWR